ncbi:hypothetical protein [Paractinoplanes brasiliensis]|uniref:Uncharacterized protein n=1 Tax=Paractinoplanes brasiliensis TaxID=52695 RepID=A0A4R6JPZ2_9ACTN|nr:hypothetical protein [Actinoplanes brasiliensis]TDO38399.1 hypothetical protein C8E87_2052 [Actinoplanes brasiliensis]GID26824.1 hypothetical protein Abr02nite_18070 [Actinoplanes brasiliensis]
MASDRSALAASVIKPRTAPVDVTDPARIARLALNALGRSVQQVADALTAAGHTGQVESSGSCPIARYLLAADPALTAVRVDGRAARLDRADETAWVRLPWPVELFVTRFDTGGYPHLIDTSCLPTPLADPGTTDGTEDRS